MFNLGLFDSKKIRVFSNFLFFLSFLVFISSGIFVFMSNITALSLNGEEINFWYWLTHPDISNYYHGNTLYNENVFLRITFVISIIGLIVATLLQRLNKNRGGLNVLISFFTFIFMLWLSFKFYFSLIFVIIATLLLTFSFRYFSIKLKLKEKFIKNSIKTYFNSYLISNNIAEPEITQDRNSDFITFMKQVWADSKFKIKKPFKYFSSYKDFKKKHFNDVNAELKMYREISFSSVLKSIFYFLIFNLIFTISFHTFNFKMYLIENHVLNNQAVTILNTSTSNICLKDKERAKLLDINCYHDKFSANITKNQALFISIIDKNGSIISFGNIKDILNSLESYNNKDLVFLYQNIVKGIERKNEHFKTLSHYDPEVKYNLIGNQILEKININYKMSLEMNPDEFIEYITREDTQSIFKDYIINIDENAEKNTSMQEIYDIYHIYENFHNHKKEKTFNSYDYLIDFYFNNREKYFNNLL